MKKLFILLSVVLCTALVGCSKDSNNSGNSNSPIVGTWLYDDSEEGFNYQVILTFNTNSNFTMTVNAEDESNSINGSYTYNAPELSLYANNGESMFVHATISGNILTWTSEGESMTFYRQ